MSSFGDRLRAARAARGLTQDELADLIGVTKSAVSAWENDREAPSFDKLSGLREHLRTSLDTLVCAETTNGHVGEATLPYGEDSPASRDEVRLLRRVRRLSERRRKALITLLDE